MKFVPMFDIIAFDADDTLWHTESLYIGVQDKFVQLLAGHTPHEDIERRLYQTEMQNIQHYGYGIKSFVLSMIETAIELTEGKITGAEIRKVIGLGKEMLAADIRLLNGAMETVTLLSKTYPLMLITKGDLLDQEMKIEKSGLREYFCYIEIVPDKTRDDYAALFTKYNLQPSRFLMVGNSLRSDILPVVELGGHAVYVPYHITWAHENANPLPETRHKYHQIEHLGLLPELVERLC